MYFYLLYVSKPYLRAIARVASARYWEVDFPPWGIPFPPRKLWKLKPSKKYFYTMLSQNLLNNFRLIRTKRFLYFLFVNPKVVLGEGDMSTASFVWMAFGALPLSYNVTGTKCQSSNSLKKILNTPWIVNKTKLY